MQQRTNQPSAPRFRDLPLHRYFSGEDWRFERAEEGIYTNVPHLVTHHSPDGYEIGYQGSGPADLALNLCEYVVTALGHEGPRIRCWRGTCYEAAFLIHQDFKRKFIAPLPKEGGTLAYGEVEQWIEAELAALELPL